ncbi:hypothetical protein ONS96_012974 [Cadophora gregata f. sp. sojae]|nr:hypothetical protein ONS96_012974 [Cadophora gregata f. sp. sojae]
MKGFNGQLHRQQPRGHPKALVDSLRDSPRLDIPSIPPIPVDLSPSIPKSRFYSHPYVNSRVHSSYEDDDQPPRRARLYSSSEDDDLPARPTRSRNKVISKRPLVALARSPSPPRNRNQLIQRDCDFLDFQKLFWVLDLDANRRFQLFVIPDEMYHPWTDESRAIRQISNAETNPHFMENKPALAVPREPKMIEKNLEEAFGDEPTGDKPKTRDLGLFSVYSYKLVTEQILQTQLAIEKSQQAAVVNRSFEKIRDQPKYWAIGCDFTIYSRSERLGLQNTPIVPFNLQGTSIAARSFILAETLMRKLAFLELCSIFELPPVSTSADLAKIAYAFYRGEEVPENVESLPNSPDAIPKEFRIYENGRSDRAKVIASKPLHDEAFQLFLQDVLISDHLEQVYNEKRSTMSGNLRVCRHSSYADTKEKLRAHERSTGKRGTQQAPRDREKRQAVRRKAWWNTYHAIIAKAEQDFAKAEKAIEDADITIREVTGFRLDGSYSMCRDDNDGDSTTEVGEGETNEPVQDFSHAPEKVGEDLGSNTQPAKSQAAPEKISSATKSKKSKGKGQSKKRKTAAGSGGVNTSAGESSTILQPSTSDATATNSIEAENVPEVATNAATQQPSTEFVVEVPSSSAPSTTQPTTSVSSLVPPDGKGKKNRKKKKDQSTDVSDDTLPASSRKVNDVQTSKSTSAVSQGQSTKNSASDSEESEKKSNKNPAQVSVTPCPVLSPDALGISLPTDGEAGAWETVKPRTAQKPKVNESTTTKGGSKAVTSLAEVSHPRPQQGPKFVSAPTAPTARLVLNPPKDIRIFDPDEYPAMPTPVSDNSKAQGKDTHDSKSISVPELAISAKQVALVTPAVPNVAHGTVTPTPFAEEIDTDPEDLYGASPPRKTRTAAGLDVANDAAESTKGKDKSSTIVQGAIKPAVPESVVQAGKGKGTPTITKDTCRVVTSELSAPTEEASVFGTNNTVTGFQIDEPVDSKPTAPAATEKIALDSQVDNAIPKADSKCSVNNSKGQGTPSSTNTTSNCATASKECKGKSKTAASSDTKSEVNSAATGPSKQSEGKGKADAKLGSTKTQISRTENSSTPPVGVEAATGDTNKKTTHKLKHLKGKGSSSGRASAKALTTEFKNPPVSDEAASSMYVPSRGTTSQGIPVKKASIENVAPAAEAVSEVNPALAQEQPATKIAEKPDFKDTSSKLAPVPTDLAWADLVSPTKPGYLKKRRCSVDNARDDDNLNGVQSPFRRSSISTGHASEQRVIPFGQLPILAASSSTVSDDPFVTEGTEKEPDAQQKDPDVSVISSSTDEAEQRDSRASPEVDVTPRTDLMLTPASPESYNGEPYLNKDGNVVTMFRHKAETSNLPGQSHHQCTHSGSLYGNSAAVPASNTIQGRSGHSSGRSSQANFNTGQGSHSHPPPAAYAPQQTTGYVVHQGGQQGSSSTPSLGVELKGKGTDLGTQGGMVNQGLSPIPEASVGSEVDSEEEGDHNPPTKCTFCEKFTVPTAANPFHFCPLCGVISGHPFYCSKACLLADSWDHSQVCRHTPPYTSNVATDFGPTYHMETFPLNNLYYLPDSAEKYRQKIFAMFYKYGDVPDIRAAHLKKWPGVDWTQILPSKDRARVGEYHVFKSQASYTGQNLSRSHVICTVKFPLNDGTGYKVMITRALNVALVTHDFNISHFLYSILRFVLMDPLHFNSFGAIEPLEVVMKEFKSQFFKEFGVIFKDDEHPMDVQLSFKQIEPTIWSYESRLGVLQYWHSAVYTEGRLLTVGLTP